MRRFLSLYPPSTPRLRELGERPTSTRLQHRALALALVLASGCLASAPLAAQSDRYELSPSFGFQFGGEHEAFDDLGRFEIQVDESDSLGLTFDLPLSRHFQIEFLWLEQDTELRLDEGFGETVFFDDTKLSFWHAGGLWQWVGGQVQPFVTATAGVTRIDPGITRVETEHKPSLSFGGGVKVFFTDHFGLRLDGRLLVTILETNDHDHDGCCRRHGRDDSSELTQGRFAAGLILAF